jgi:hypothetical protein
VAAAWTHTGADGRCRTGLKVLRDGDNEGGAVGGTVGAINAMDGAVVVDQALVEAMGEGDIALAGDNFKSGIRRGCGRLGMIAVDADGGESNAGNEFGGGSLGEGWMGLLSEDGGTAALSFTISFSALFNSSCSCSCSSSPSACCSARCSASVGSASFTIRSPPISSTSSGVN